MSELKNYLGQEVFVIVDRPLGSKHPKWDYFYPINYWYIPDTLAWDWKEIDVHILWEDKPLSEFNGVVIAIVKRKNDNEDKLVVARKWKRFSVKEIREWTYFQEKYFDIEIIL